jgi:imidazolonepropionase-like amidohydrolase
VARRMAIVSTLDIHSYGRRTPALETAVDNLARFSDAGGRVVYGTDLGNGPIPPGIDVGEALHLAAAGLSPDAILASMTRSRLEAGSPGDVVGLGGNPLEDLAAFGRVRLVVRSGRVRRMDR